MKIVQILVGVFSMAMLSSVTVEASDEAFRIKLEKNSRLMVILPKTIPGNGPLQQQYFENVDALEQGRFGLGRHGTLVIEKTIVGDFGKPAVVALMSFPSREKELNLMSLPGWPAIKQSRSSIWEELIINGLNLSEEADWSFKANKVYSFEFIWHKDSNKKIQGYSHQSKLIANLNPDTYESLDDGNTPPDLISISEWDNKDAFDKAFADISFQQYLLKNKSHFTRHEIYQAIPRIEELKQ